MNKIIIVTSCNECPYCKNYYTSTMRIYEGTLCIHPENKAEKMFYLGDWEDRCKIHKKCPLDDES